MELGRLLLLLLVGLRMVEATAETFSLDWRSNVSREGLSDKFLVGCALFRNEAPFLVHILSFTRHFPSPTLLVSELIE